MKHLRIITGLLCAATLASTAAPQVKWLTPDYDFGAIAEADGTAQGELRFVNTGDAPLAVTAVHTSCGCTTAKIPTGEIEPGDTAVIAVNYDPTGRPGKFEKKVTVNFSDDIPKSSVKIHGVVIGTAKTLQRRYPVDAGVMKLNSSVVPFGDVRKSTAKSAFIEVYNASRDTITPTWSRIPDYISVAPMDGRVAPGQQMVFNLMFSGYRCPDYGLVTDSVFIAPAPDAVPVRLDVVGIVNEDFSRLTPGQLSNAPAIKVSTDRLDFGTFDAGNPAVMSFTVTNTGKDPLLLRRVYTTDKGITVTVDKDKVKKGKQATVTVTVDPSQLPGDILNARISIISNDPDNPVINLRAVGLPR